MEYRSQTIRVNGVRLHYQEWGRPGDPPLLLLHGLTQQSHAFDAMAARLCHHFHALALDLRGRGESDWASPETYAVPQYVADVAALLGALGIARVHVFGTSLGGLLGLSVEAALPGTLLSLGLNDIGPEIDPRGAARIAAYTAAVPTAFADFDEALAWAQAQYPWLARMSRPAVVEAVRWAVRQGTDGAWRLKFDPAIGRSARPAPEAIEAARRQWWETFGRLTCRILLVRGAESDVLGAGTAAEMARRQPAMVRVEVPGVGHAPTLTEAAAVAALDRFYLDAA